MERQFDARITMRDVESFTPDGTSLAKDLNFPGQSGARLSRVSSSAAVDGDSDPLRLESVQRPVDAFDRH